MSTPRLNSKQKDSKQIDVSTLSTKLRQSANQAVAFLESQMQPDGSYKDAKDLACYFKSPMMYLAADKPASALRVLKHIKKIFMSADGDFKTSDAMKSANGAYVEYWAYTNGWIIRAANRLGQTDISNPGFEYLNKFKLSGNLGFLTNSLDSKSSDTDVLTVAHHGLINLEMNKVDAAIAAGNYLCETLSKQPDLQQGFYLRINSQGVITHYPAEKTAFYFVSSTQPNQLHFMIGYPSAYLAMLYKYTDDMRFLKAAKAYLDFSLSCDESVYHCNFSHKIAWAASLVYECTGDKKYLGVIDRITSYFIENQKDGMWFGGDINSSYDQSAEIASWFLDIVKNINNCKKKVNLDEAKSETSAPQSWTSQAIKYGVMALVTGVGLYALFRSGNSALVAGAHEAIIDASKRLGDV